MEKSDEKRNHLIAFLLTEKKLIVILCDTIIRLYVSKLEKTRKVSSFLPEKTKKAWGSNRWRQMLLTRIVSVERVFQEIPLRSKVTGSTKKYFAT